MSTENLFVQSSDEATLTKLVNFTTYEKLVNNAFLWHKFIILNGTIFDKNHILDLIIKKVSPAVLFPIRYHADGRNTAFLAQNCEAVIKILANNQLTLHCPETGITIELQLILNYQPNEDEKMPMPTDRLIIRCFGNRYNKATKVLDLSYFHLDPGLQGMFCAVWHTSILRYVLQLGRHMFSKVYSYLLLEGLNISCVTAVFLPHLIGLDLSNNKITWDSLSSISSKRVRDIWLRGNPLCLECATPQEYAKKVLQHFTSLSTLDGLPVSLSQEGFILARNFLVRGKGLKSFTDQFLLYYFGLFETPEGRRTLVSKGYHPEASFSLSVCEIPNQTSSARTRLSEMMGLSRNLLKMSDWSRAYLLLKVSHDDINQAFHTLPIFFFQPASFTVDVPYYQEDKVAFMSISGTMSDSRDSLKLPGNMYHFHATFFLVASTKSPGRWLITNHMMGITNGTTLQATKGLWDRIEVVDAALKVRGSEDEIRKGMVGEMMDLTTMSEPWVTKFLNEASWDLEIALQAFTDQYKAQQIPVEAFNNYTT